MFLLTGLHEQSLAPEHLGEGDVAAGEGVLHGVRTLPRRGGQRQEEPASNQDENGMWGGMLEHVRGEMLTSVDVQGCPPPPFTAAAAAAAVLEE